MKSFGELFNKLKESEKLISNFRNAILYTVIVKIKDPKSRTILWNCNEDEWYDTRFEGLEVEQEIDMNSLLSYIEDIMNGKDI